MCPYHDQRYELYCPNHSAACCLQCFTEKHQNCKDLKRLTDIMKDIKSLTSVTRVEQDLNDANENYEMIITYLNRRLSTILNQKKTKIEEINLIRKSLNEHLDNLEQRMIKELVVEHNKLETETKKVINQVETKRSRVKNYLEDLTKMKNFATELQTFIGIQEMENMTTEEVRYLQKLIQSGDLDELNIEVKISSDVKSAVQKLICFGSVSVSSVPCSLELKKKVECQVPIFVPTVKTINDISPVLKQKIMLPKNATNITGCQILPNGHLLFVDKALKQLIKYKNKDNDIETVMTFGDTPYYVCYIKENTVAVTLPKSHKILKIDLVSREIVKTIVRENNTKCYGIDSNGKVIVVAEYLDGFNQNESVYILDLEGRELRCINMNSKFWEGLTMFKDKFYCTNWNSNKVLSMQDDGDTLWENDTKELSKPIGIAIDNNQCIYVACEKNSKIIIISPDGLTSRILLSTADEINEPTDISIDRETQSLLVSNRRNGVAFLFSI
ncbi:Hypothetical predicted protein [Mytilus galloprovincialis]|uniref:B box-type domain-containing protein n=1 Tax=Mytilus galloprovincialis TaxID=29158 RepID=A0A8B6G3W4_MYTGA|nr:Hypothetical predicted protein [Mytilus galloprovincialis]